MRPLNNSIQHEITYLNNSMSDSKYGLNTPSLQAHLWIGKYSQSGLERQQIL